MEKKPEKPPKSKPLRLKAEELYKSMQTRHNEYTDAEKIKLIHELGICQIELELQNEELRMARDNAEAMENKYKELYDYAPSGYYTLNSEGRIVDLNLAGSALLGYERSDLKNKLLGFYISTEDNHVFGHFLERVFKSSVVETCKLTLVPKDNKPITVSLTGISSELRDHCRVTMIDVSELIDSKNNLIAGIEKFRRLADNSPSIIYRILLKPAMRFDYVSPAVTAITGYTPEDHYNDPQLGFKLIHPDDRQLLEDTTLHSKGEPLVLRWVKKDGTVIWTEQRNVLIFDQEGEPCAIEGQARDITEAKNAENERKKIIHRSSLLLDLYSQSKDFTDKELFDKALDIAVQITESRIGFFHQVSDDQQEIILTTWNDEARKNCTSLFDSHYPLDIAGIWADCVRQKKTLVYNDFSVAQNKKGLPEGHVFLGRFMSIPVLKDDKVQMIFGVGNKESDYTPFDVIQIQEVANELFKISEKRKVEQALRRSEERWQFAIEGSNDGVWDWNLETNEVFYSDRWKEMLGFKPDEISGSLDSWDQRVHPDDKELVYASMYQHINGETDHYDSEYRIQCMDGSWKWILDRGKVIEWSSQHKAIRMLGTHTDISERKFAEERILNDSKKFRILNELMSDYIFELTPQPDGNFKMAIVAGNYEKATGYKIDEIATMADWNKMVHPHDIPLLRRKLNQVINDRQPIALECRSFTKNGILRWVEVTATLETDTSTGEIIAVYGNVKNITSKKQAEKTLEESEFKYRMLADSGSALIWTSGTDKLCTYFNNTWLNFTGRKLEQEIGNGWTEGVHPDDFGRCLETYTDSFDKREAFEMEYRLRHSSGDYRWLVDMGIPNYSSSGEFIGYIGHCFDISERRLVEDTQRFLLSCGLPGTGEDFFVSLARYLATTLRMEYVCIDSLEGDGLTAQTVAVYNDGIVEPNTRYALKDTPCGEVFDKSVCCYREGVRRLFPKDSALQDLNAESYVGTTLIDSKGRAIGLIAIIGHQILHEPQRAESLLKLVALRAASELERREAETKLNDTLAQLNAVNLHLEERVKKRTREIVEISALQKAILENAPFAILTTNLEGIFQSINPAGEKMLGYDAEEIIGKKSPLYFHDREELERFCTEKTGNPQPDENLIHSTALKAMFQTLTEWTWVRKDGTKFPVKISHSSLISADGKVTGFMGLILDITQEKKFLDAIMESEKRFYSMFQDHSAIMLLVDPELGEIVDANKAARKYYGYNFDNNPKKRISDINMLSPVEIEKEMDLALNEQHSYFVFKHMLASGEIRFVEVHSTPIRTETSTLLFLIIHDVTERLVAEDALRKSEAENRAIIQAVPDLMFRIHRDGTYLESHTRNESSLYVPKEMFIGKNINEVLPPDLAAQSADSMENAFLTGKVSQYEYELEINNSIRFFENRILAITDVEVLSIIRDITDRKTAENNLKEALRKLSTLIQNLQTGTLFESGDRHITLVNQSFCDIFSIPATPEQMIGYDCVAASDNSKILMKDPEGFIRRIEEILSRGEVVVNDELYLVNGSVLERDYIPIKENNVLLGHLWQYRDITHHKESEAALKMQSAAFESFSVALIITDVAGHIKWANTAFTKLSGYSLAETLGNTPGQLVKSGKQDQEFYKQFWNSIKSKKNWSGEIINMRKDGSLYYEEETITPVLDHESNISGFIAIKIDITERKSMEKALRESEARWNFALEGSGDGVWDWKIPSGEVFLSNQWKAMLGYENHEVGNTIEEWENRLHPEDRKQCYIDLENHFKGETEVYVNEHRMLCRDGSYMWILARGKVIEWNADLTPYRIIGTQTDISERKAFEHSLSLAIEREKELNELKTKFISITSHEFRTPLATILASNESLSIYWDRMTIEQRNMRFDKIKGQVEQLNRYITEMLHLSKLQAKDWTLAPERFDFIEMITIVTDELSHLPDNAGRIVVSLPHGPLEVFLDKKIMQSIITNLLTNALKYSPSDKNVSLVVQLKGKKLIITVEDRGIGIPDEDLKHLFEPFFRASNSGNVKGTGLGLNIVKESVERHKGRLNLKTKLNTGTKFTLELPVDINYPIK